MTETVRYSKLYLEDLDIGTGTKQIRLANGGVYELSQINLNRLLTVTTTILSASAFSGLPAMIWTNGLPASRRIWGVTVKNLVALGTANGLTGYLVGDATTDNRWSNTICPLTVPWETDEGDFADPSLMVYPTPQDIILSGVGGLYAGTGQVQVAVHSSFLRHPG